MAIVVGTPAVGNASSIGGSEYELAFEVPTGTKLLVFGVAVQFQGSPQDISARWSAPTSQDMTRVVTASVSSRRVAIFTLKNPTAGSYSCVYKDSSDVGI